MTYVTICQPCREGRHEDCLEVIDPLTPEEIAEGVCGGGMCICGHGAPEGEFERGVREGLERA